MRYFLLTILVTLVNSLSSVAQNPVFPGGVYIANPSAHVWKDGKVYVYGSNDESTKYYSSSTYHVFSTSDLKTWEITKDVFSSKGIKDSLPYNNDRIFAPDCIYSNGTYYLYYCQSPTVGAEGVATSKSPTGPFGNATKINTKGFNEIDPCVFIDDDGQAYYIWGQFTAKMAKLKPNMIEIDSSTIKDNVITEKEHFFHEGVYMVKRKDTYYLIYADISRSNKPSCLGYATSKSPMGPFKYGGVIIDNDDCDPGSWNNHGSIVEFKGQWYVFYHRSTHNSFYMRKTWVEPISFNEDGSINEVEMTSQGAGAPLKATTKIEAERACLLFGGTYVDSLAASEEKLSNLKNESWVSYKYLQFPAGVNKVEMKVRPGKKSCTIQLVLDQHWHEPISSITVPAAGTAEWITLQANLKPVQGVHALWIKVFAEEGVSIDMDWFKFSQ